MLLLVCDQLPLLSAKDCYENPLILSSASLFWISCKDTHTQMKEQQINRNSVSSIREHVVQNWNRLNRINIGTQVAFYTLVKLKLPNTQNIYGVHENIL